MTTPEASSARMRPRTLALIYGSAVAAVIAFLALGSALGFSLNEITRDPLATAGLHPLTGAQSQVGVLLWWSAASISLAAWAIVRRAGSDRRLAAFLLASALVTFWLALDDAFQFHDALASDWLGLRERYVILAYAAVLGLYFLVFRRLLWQSDRTLLLLAVLFAGLSVAGDLVSQQFVEDGAPSGVGEVLNYLEDAMKFLAIVSWSAYLVRYSLAAIETSSTGASSEDRPPES